MSTASTWASASVKSATARAVSTPCPIAHCRRAGEMSATQTVAPSWVSTRRCFSPQRPRPTSRTFMAGLLAARLAAPILGNLVAEEPVLHPPHYEQVGGGHEHAVHDAVLRLPEPSRPVLHGHLQHAVTAPAGQRGGEVGEARSQHE